MRSVGNNAACEIVCVYCGALSPQTRDHVPPACLFPRPRPTDLVTVPACEACNAAFSMDDEYFRLAMLASATDHPQGAIAWTEAMRSLRKRPNLRRLL